mgnify:CR=1 FL=1
MKKIVLLASVLVLCGGAFARAACTVEEAQAMATEFSNAAMALAQKDPNRYAEVAQAMQAQLPELQKNNDLDALCRFYDEWAVKMK